MRNNKPVHINKWLLPFSWLYGLIVFFRNKFFDWGILKRKSYNVPVICVGNITVGGTGKTPHIEYLIRLLKKDYRVAVLSRGYKRQTKGFVLANQDSTAREIGDEPLQIKISFQDILVAVDANRCRGIEKLLALDEEMRPEVILLDDAFQHRYVKPSFSILLTDFNRPMSEDCLLPAGRLREPVGHASAANMIVITKCPQSAKPIDLRISTYNVNTFPYQDLLFTTLTYGSLFPLFAAASPSAKLTELKDKNVLLVAGIANPDLLIGKLKKASKTLETIIFADHHNFLGIDIRKINEVFDRMSAPKMIVITTKDAARLRNVKGLSEQAKEAMYVLPVEVSFLNKDDEAKFNAKISDHVKKNTRNSRLHKK